jgi:hypothetical protein
MPRITKRARALRDLRRLQEYRLLHIVVNTLTAESSSINSSSSGGLGLQPMETDERIQDLPPSAVLNYLNSSLELVAIFAFSWWAGWTRLVVIVLPTAVLLAQRSNGDKEDEAFLDKIISYSWKLLYASIWVAYASFETLLLLIRGAV